MQRRRSGKNERCPGDTEGRSSYSDARRCLHVERGIKMRNFELVHQVRNIEAVRQVIDGREIEDEKKHMGDVKLPNASKQSCSSDHESGLIQELDRSTRRVSPSSAENQGRGEPEIKTNRSAPSLCARSPCEGRSGNVNKIVQFVRKRSCLKSRSSDGTNSVIDYRAKRAGQTRSNYISPNAQD